MSALSIASRHGHLEMCKLLLKAGAKIDLQDEVRFISLLII